MRLLLRWNLFLETAELTLKAIDLMPRRFTLLTIQLRTSGASQSPMSAVGYGGHHLQIT
jgi:hypothetical protein